jgi:protein YIPF1/2
VVFILFLGGTISQYLAETGSAHFAYNFKLLSGMLPFEPFVMASLIVWAGAAGLVYGYTLVIPIVLFLALKYFGSESANLLECWALYGYSNLMVSNYHSELGVCRRRIWAQRYVPVEESVSSPERYG